MVMACVAFAVVPWADATNLVFKNGQQMRDVRIVARTGQFISVAVANGIVRYPLGAVATIDGKPIDEPAATAGPGSLAPAGLSAQAPEQTAAPASAPAPEPSASPNAAPPAASAAPPPAVSEPKTGPDRWNFELLLLAFLTVAGVWMRSLQAVQRDLFERRAEPRHWTMAALLLPGVGAGAYFFWLRARQKLSEIQARKLKAAAIAAADTPPADGSGTGQPFPAFNLSKRFDPAAHLAAKGSTRQGLTFLDTDRQSVAIKGDSELASGLDNANEVLEEALLEKASDIHIEPASDSYRVRFRLDGILHERMSYEPSDGVRLVTALKSLAEIDVAEKRRAQDGKFRVLAEDREIDFRVATANSIYGEKMVIRVLDHRGGIFDLTSLGMSEEMLGVFQSVLHSKNGMILATGPTGSGKTSTLYAALRQLDTTSLNIMTIEDPAEYELKGATQIAVNPRAGITYEAGLRSILRQDPDVILVGEMRDAEASAVALRAALTGHLVLSTLHTKDAIGTISRLQEMGIERYQLASALLMVIAQRLVRVLCPECRSEYPAVGDELEDIGFSFEPGQPLYAARGCDACLGTGFRGRTGLFELLVLDDNFRQTIGDGADEAAITALAVDRGFKSFRYDGAEKILLGVTTVDEVLQAS
ncbi:MAG: GspE/PulE family protein [Terrimicrobiaceae bacterium]|nr:GspE/PulE family protein [Terrimicrobiaceae bacterium]